MAETSTTTSTTKASSTVTTTETGTGDPELSIHQHNLTIPTSVSPNTKEDHRKNTQLPPFSFSKRPADEYVLKSRTLTFGDPEGDKSPLFHSHISDIIPSLSCKNTGNDTRNTASGDSTTSTSNYKDINYDEQIRFPRMNNMTYYTYTGGKRPSYSSKVSERSTTSETSTTSENPQKSSQVPEEALQDVDSKYRPAAFDLWQPLRRFSQPLEKDATPKNTESNLNEASDENLKLLKEYILNNYIYERNDEQAMLNRKISNFINENGKPKALVVDTQSSDIAKNDGTPSATNISHHPYYLPAKNTRIKNQCVFLTNSGASKGSFKLTKTPSETSSTSIATGASQSDAASIQTHIGPTNFNHLYQLKKPLSTPAVLRPMVNKDGTINEENSPPKSLISGAPMTNSIYTVTSPVTYMEDFTDTEFVEEVDVTMNEVDEQNTVSIKSIKHTPTSGPLVTLFNVEPTHNHWKPNNYSRHCMQCFKSFGNSLISILYLFFEEKRNKDQVPESKILSNSSNNNVASTHLRRHHCRFCGFIYCDSCLIQNDADDASKYSYPNKLYSTSHGRFIGKGILMDQNARFVVPIHKNLELNSSGSSTKSEVSQTSMITDPENFKLFKVCKNCGEIYKNLVIDLNKSAEEPPSADFVSEAAAVLRKFPFVFVENPYLSTFGERGSIFPSKIGLDNPMLQLARTLEPERPRNNRKDSVPGFNRKNSVNEVPSDWTWSSF